MEKRITKRDYFSKLIEIVEGVNVDNATEIGVAKASDSGYQNIVKSGTVVTS